MNHGIITSLKSNVQFDVKESLFVLVLEFLDF